MKTKRGNHRLRLKTIRRSRNPAKKYDAVFLKPNGTLITKPFGQKGYNDFILYNSKSGKNVAIDHKTRYLRRHKGMGENWNDPTTPGSLARWVLWNKPTLRGSIKDFKRRFSL